MLRNFILAALSLGLTRPLLAQAAFHYECTSDSAVGYSFDEGRRSWTPTQFKMDKASYSVRHLTDDEMEKVIYKGKAWGVFEPEDKVTVHTCPELDSDRLVCGGVATSFILDSHSLRYQKYYAGGYVSGQDNNDDTPSVEIGRCRIVSGAR